ncbi:MAG: phosphoglycolate phosphatase [Alphaproteobacteria bacterium]|nr:phosphoglycolate phosphatase [Alphaproteobacteria bacterium]
MTERLSGQSRGALIFDLDGTLVDTAPDLLAALNGVLAERRRAALPDSMVRHLVGDGAAALVRRGMAATGAEVAEADLAPLVERFIALYRKDIATRSRPFPGVVDTLATLSGRGYRFAVCTNKRHDLTLELLDALGLRSLFPVVIGGDSLPTRKPDPGMVIASLAALDATPAGAVMVGDSLNDVRAAQAAKVPVIAVAYGYAQVADLGADAVIEQFDHLPAALARLS